MIKVYILDITNYQIELVPLSEYKKALLNKTTNEKRIKEIRIGESLLVYALKDMGLNINAPLSIEVTNSGKPYLKNERIHFNISHSANFYVVAISLDPVGIDIEVINNQNLKLAEKILDEKEFTMYNECDNKLAYLIEMWTVKESYLKLIGSGITSDMTKIGSTLVFKSEENKVYTVNDKKVETYRFKDAYLSVASNEKKEIFVKEIGRKENVSKI